MSRRHAYLGRAGQLVVMAELAERGWNVAVPEIDFGDDIILLDDATGELRRIQVKTARGRVRKVGFSATFKVGLEQLLTPRLPDLVYVFVVRMEGCWERFIIISRARLEREHAEFGVGNVSDHGRGVLIVVWFAAEQAHAAVVRGNKRQRPRRDFSRFVAAWDPHLPRLLFADANVGK